MQVHVLVRPQNDQNSFIVRGERVPYFAMQRVLSMSPCRRGQSGLTAEVRARSVMGNIHVSRVSPSCASQLYFASG